MTDQKIFDEIENGDARYDLLYATGVFAMQWRLERHPFLQTLLPQVLARPDLLQECIARLKSLARDEEERGYANPDRNIVAIYTYLLFNSDNEDGLNLIRDLAIRNRPDWLDVTDLIRLYAWRRPALEVRASSSRKEMLARINLAFNGPENSQETNIADIAGFENSTANTNFVTQRGYAMAA